jgi:hypothetical protein
MLSTITIVAREGTKERRNEGTKDRRNEGTKERMSPTFLTAVDRDDGESVGKLPSGWS